MILSSPDFPLGGIARAAEGAAEFNSGDAFKLPVFRQVLRHVESEATRALRTPKAGWVQASN